MSVLATKHYEGFDVIDGTEAGSVSVLDAPAPCRIASDDEASAAFSYAISKHKKALEELAKYDRS